jgi:hypothetical protein
MKQELALRVLGEIMGWSEDEARRQFSWLELMARFKYNEYSDYVAGARFIECLADWLQQFDPEERAQAYNFVRTSLLFFGATEIHHLVELVYLEVIQPRLLRTVAQRLGVPPYMIWSRNDAESQYNQLLRKSLFFGLSDGARIEIFRRENTGTISNEQVVLATEIGDQKWDSLLRDLREDLRDPVVKFAFIFLLDDFLGTGKTLIRQREGEWIGRLPKFWNVISKKLDSHFEPGLRVYVHHYISTYEASRSVPERFALARSEKAKDRWLSDVGFSFGMILPDNIRVGEKSHPAFMQLVRKYYDASLETRHTSVGGTKDVRLGFGQSALPVILESNTPNNSVALLWAETDGDKGSVMRPLFRRRQRHSDLEVD